MNLAIYELDLQTRSAVAVVGLGFIGRSIANQLYRYQAQGVDVQEFPVDWNAPMQLAENILSTCESQNYHSVDIIWSAGRGGFSSSDAQMRKEFQFFKTSMNALRDKSKLSLIVNFLSSAGGLYENSGHVSSMEQISINRPYSEWKYKQEQFLETSAIPNRVFRISSVYGPSDNDMRRGLINTLVRCAYFRETVTISANQNTLRDYVFIRDVARHIVESVTDNTSCTVELLASGRSASIDMLKNIVSKSLFKDVLITYKLDFKNDENITFDKSLVAFAFPPTPLEEGIPLSIRCLNAA